MDITTFQRFSNLEDFNGLKRPQGNGFDAGAFEVLPMDFIIFTDGFESGNTGAWM